MPADRSDSVIIMSVHLDRRMDRRHPDDPKRDGRGFSGPRARLRVAVVTHGFTPLLGGAETHFLIGAERLGRKADVIVLTAALCLDPSRRAYLHKLSRPPQDTGSDFDVIYLPSLYVMREKLLLPLSLMRQLIHLRPDSIWTSHPSAGACVAAMYAKVKRVRWVATYHADISRDSWIRRLFIAFESLLLRSASTVEVSSPRYARRLNDRGIARERIAVVQPFTREDRLGAGPTGWAWDTDVRAGPDHPFIFVGALDQAHAYKNPDVLLRAVASLRQEGNEIHLSVVGDGPDRARLELLADELGVRSLIRFKGWLSDAELSQLYDRAWALVLPSSGDSEGFGLVILEALSHGCPVICSDSVPGIDRFARDLGGLEFAAGNSQSLMDCMQSLSTEPGLRRSLARQITRIDLRREGRESANALVDIVLGSAVESTQ